jgi:hypothetical protein
MAAPTGDFAYQVPEPAGGKIAVRVEAAKGPVDPQDWSMANRTLAPGASGISKELPAAVSADTRYPSVHAAAGGPAGLGAAAVAFDADFESAVAAARGSTTAP